MSNTDRVTETFWGRRGGEKLQREQSSKEEDSHVATQGKRSVHTEGAGRSKVRANRT